VSARVAVPLRRLLVLTVLLGLLAACSDGDPQEMLDRAPEALEEAGTSRFEMLVTAVGEDGAEEPPFRAEGEQDLTDGTMRMVFDLGDEGSRTETLLAGNIVYLRAPLFALFTGDPDRWVRLDLEAAGEEAGLDPDQLVPTDAGPTALLQQLRGAAEDIEELGREEIRGFDPHHLRVTVVSDRAIAQAPEAMREQLQAYAEATGLPDRYPMEVWIDDDGLPRRIRTVLEIDDAARGAVTQETTLELFDFGVAVDLTPPEGDDVVDLDEVLRQLAELEAELETSADQ
jgi:hypothetical protein